MYMYKCSYVPRCTCISVVMHVSTCHYSLFISRLFCIFPCFSSVVEAAAPDVIVTEVPLVTTTSAEAESCAIQVESEGICVDTVQEYIDKTKNNSEILDNALSYISEIFSPVRTQLHIRHLLTGMRSTTYPPSSYWYVLDYTPAIILPVRA